MGLRFNGMKVFVQHTVTGLYFKEIGEWVKDQERARSFDSSLPAIDLCVQNQIYDAVILLTFEEPKYDIQLRPFFNRADFGPSNPKLGS